MRQIQKIPVFFNGMAPTKKNEGYVPELGNYEWYLNQYKIIGQINIEDIEENEALRNNLVQKGVLVYLPFNEADKYPDLSERRYAPIMSSKLTNLEEVKKFIMSNYKGFSPYSEGVNEKKALELTNKLIASFLSCSPGKALYIRYRYASTIKSKSGEQVDYFTEPYLVSGFYGIFDPVNNEFFELIMGGTD